MHVTTAQFKSKRWRKIIRCRCLYCSLDDGRQNTVTVASEEGAPRSEVLSGNAVVIWLVKKLPELLDLDD